MRFFVGILLSLLPALHVGITNAADERVQAPRRATQPLEQDVKERLRELAGFPQPLSLSRNLFAPRADMEYVAENTASLIQAFKALRDIIPNKEFFRAYEEKLGELTSRRFVAFTTRDRRNLMKTPEEFLDQKGPLTQCLDDIEWAMRAMFNNVRDNAVIACQRTPKDAPALREAESAYHSLRQVDIAIGHYQKALQEEVATESDTE